MKKHDDIFKDVTIRGLLERAEKGEDSRVIQEADSLFSLILKIDKEAAEGGATHFQPNWIDYFNTKSKRMISLPDLYLVGRYGDDNLLQSLRDDFTNFRVITSTTFELEKNKIWCFHNYQSKFVKTKEIKLDIHDNFVTGEYNLNDFLFKEYVDKENRLLFMRGILDTKADAKTMANNLERLSDYTADKIVISIPNKVERCMTHQMMGVMHSTTYRFKIDLEYMTYSGRSRGVSLK